MWRTTTTSEPLLHMKDKIYFSPQQCREPTYLNNSKLSDQIRLWGAEVENEPFFARDTGHMEGNYTFKHLSNYSNQNDSRNKVQKS